MGIPHAQPGEVIDLRKPAEESSPGLTRTLINGRQMEVIRLELPAGKIIPEHKTPGEIIVQGIEGRVRFHSMGTSIEVGSGQLFYLAPGELHSVESLQDSSLLVTIIKKEHLQQSQGGS